MAGYVPPDVYVEAMRPRSAEQRMKEAVHEGIDVLLREFAAGAQLLDSNTVIDRLLDLRLGVQDYVAAVVAYNSPGGPGAGDPTGRAGGTPDEGRLRPGATLRAPSYELPHYADDR